MLPMLSPDKIHFYLSLFKNLSFSDLLMIIRMAKKRELMPGEVLIDEGALTSRIAYIKEGLMRAYQLNEKGEEITFLLRWEDQFIASHDNIFFKKPSRFIYQALEKTTVLEIDYDAVSELMTKYPKLEESRHYFLINMLAQSMARVESFVMLNPEERYLQLIQEKPNLVQRVPDKHLATLLGITPVSLSRIRKRIASRARR
ncbi:MAG: Crp/Fnr family transcriptional regulator [Bacteroidetes bacterium]|nr:Crp/Fnr family transcriptional regulator [Bacteroidota bacterium]